MEQRLEHSWNRKQSQHNYDDKIILPRKSDSSLFDHDDKKRNPTLKGRREFNRTNNLVGNESQKISQPPRSDNHFDLLNRIQRQHSYGSWHSLRSNPLDKEFLQSNKNDETKRQKRSEFLKDLQNRANRIQSENAANAKANGDFDRTLPEISTNSNDFNEMSRKLSEKQVWSRPLRNRHQSMPDFVQSSAGSYPKLGRKLGQSKGKSDLSSQLSISKNPVQDLIAALREDVEKLTQHRENQRLKAELTARQDDNGIENYQGSRKKAGLSLSRSRSFGAIEHEYLNSRGETAPKVLPRSSSKEAIHKLAKLHRVGSTQSEKRLLDISFQSEGDVFRTNSDNSSDESNSNRPIVTRPPPPRSYKPSDSFRSRNLSEPYLSSRTKDISLSLKDALNDFEREVRNPQRKVETKGKVFPHVTGSHTGQDSDLEVEYRSSAHSSLSGVSSTSLLTSPNSNISAHSSSQRSSTNQENPNNYYSSSTGDPESLESRIDSFYEGDPQSMDWLTKKFDFLQSEIAKKGTRNKSNTYHGVKILPTSNNIEPSRTLFTKMSTESKLKPNKSSTIPKSNSFAGDKQTSGTNWKFQKMDPKFIPKSPLVTNEIVASGAGGGGGGSRHSKSTPSPHDNSLNSFVYDFEPSTLLMDGLPETDILGKCSDIR